MNSIWGEWLLRIIHPHLIYVIIFAEDHSPSAQVQAGDWKDLIYEVERVDPKTGQRHTPLPMLAPYSSDWLASRLRDAWRGYVGMMMCEHSHRFFLCILPLLVRL